MLTDAPTNTNVRQRVTIKRCAFLFHACKRKYIDCKPSAYHGFPKGNNLVLLLFLLSKNNNKYGHPKDDNHGNPVDDHTCCSVDFVKIKEAHDDFLSGNHGKPKAYNQYICACMHGKEKHSA